MVLIKAKQLDMISAHLKKMTESYGFFKAGKTAMGLNTGQV